MSKITIEVPDELMGEFRQILLEEHKKVAPLLRGCIEAYVRAHKTGRAVPVEEAPFNVKLPPSATMHFVGKRTDVRPGSVPEPEYVEAEDEA